MLHEQTTTTQNQPQHDNCDFEEVEGDWKVLLILIKAKAEYIQ